MFFNPQSVDFMTGVRSVVSAGRGTSPPLVGVSVPVEVAEVAEVQTAALTRPRELSLTCKAERDPSGARCGANADVSLLNHEAGVSRTTEWSSL